MSDIIELIFEVAVDLWPRTWKGFLIMLAIILMIIGAVYYFTR